VNRKLIALVLAFVLSAGLAGYWYWTGDERAIRRQLALIEEAGAKQGAEQPVEALLKATQIAGLCVDPCRVTVESVQQTVEVPRKLVLDRVAMVRSLYTRLSVSLLDLVVEIPKHMPASVRGAIALKGEIGNESVADVLEFRAEMSKVEGTWLITSVTLTEVLKR
jgi:hypothetical protein